LSLAFHPSDLQSERIALYSRKNWAVHFRSKQFTYGACRANVCDPPAEEQLAVLTAGQIALYRIPGTPRRALNWRAAKQTRVSTQLQ
jgi:hypothetical protein